MSDNREIYGRGEHRQHNIQHDYGGGFASNSNYRSPIRFSDYLRETVDYGALARAFDMSCPPSYSKEVNQVVNQVDHTSAAASGTPMTPNSSISSASTEAAGDHDLDSVGGKKEQEQQAQGEGADGGTADKSKNKAMKARKTGEKRQKEPRFAFMTKSDVDHLEDGYKWRKYGQKAVKNSPYPRSYYRCTTPKCSVKKRVERSFQDPAIVVTTYEGQHTHPCPGNLRTSSHFLAAGTSPMTAGFGREPPMLQRQFTMHPSDHLDGQGGGGTNLLPLLQKMSPAPPQRFQAQADYGLLEDMVPHFTHKQQQ